MKMKTIAVMMMKIPEMTPKSILTPAKNVVQNNQTKSQVKLALPAAVTIKIRIMKMEQVNFVLLMGRGRSL